MFSGKHGCISFVQILACKLWPIEYTKLNEIITVVLAKFELYKSMILFVSALYSLTTEGR